MSPKSAIPLLLTVGLIFIGFGDKFLPQPLSGTSLKTRTALNQMMLGSFTMWQPKTRPYERTEKALEQEQSGKAP